VTLLLAAGTADAAARAMEAAPHLAAHEARAAADADPASVETLTTASGIADIDHGVVWAAARVRGSLLRGSPGTADTRFWSGLGALAVGDAAAAAHALAALPHDALSTLLAARMTLLTGDPAPALDAQRLLDLPRPEPGAAIPDGANRGLWRLALETLADALRFAAADGDVQALRRAAGLQERSRKVLPLPMAGRPIPPTPADGLRALFTEATDPDGAWTSWRATLARGMAGGATGRGAWDPLSPPPGPAPEAGRLLCALAHGFLGLAPDAPSARIRIAPAFPSHVTAFAAAGIRVGDAAFSFRYERVGRRHRFTLEPARGRTPITAVLEPSLPAAGIASARVDEAPAELDWAVSGRRTRTRVQIVLDAPRTLEIDATE
jgi:hypothetical protein